MAYRFDGVDDRVEFAIAPLSGYTVGPITMAMFLQPAAPASANPIGNTAITTSAPSGRVVHRTFDSRQAFVGNGTTDTGPQNITSSSTWYLAVVTWAGGAAVPRYHVHNGTAWIHTNGSAAVTAYTIGATDRLFVGGYAATTYLAADVICVGIKKANPTDVQVEALTRSSFQSWRNFGFDWLIGFDASLEAAGILQDQAFAGTGDEIAIVGTTPVADPAGWSWAPDGGFGKIKFGTDLVVTDEGAGVIRVDVSPGKVDRDAVAAGAARLVQVKLAAGDTQPAFKITGDGTHTWGPGGATAPDTNLYRPVANTLQTPATLYVGGELINYGGNIKMTTNTGRLYFGSADDTNLYRPAAGVLKTDGAVAVAGNYATTLPASPVNGQEAVLVDSITNPSYQWTFRYNAGSTSAYKWELVGGTEWQAAPAGGADSTASVYTTFVDFAAGPSVVAPRAGDYIARFSLHADNNTVNCSPMAGLRFGAAGVVANTDLTFAVVNVASSQVCLAHQARLNGVAAGDTIRVSYCVLGGGTSAFSRRQLFVQPVRVA